MAENNFGNVRDRNVSTKSHELFYGGGKITVQGVTKVVQISERECVFRLDGQTLTLRGEGLSVTKLDRDGGSVTLELQHLSSVVYGKGFKGLFS